MRSAPLAALALLVAACAPEPSEVAPDPDAAEATTEAAFSDAPPPGAEQLVITSTDGAVDLGLTDRVVFFRLSPKQRAEIEEDLATKTEGERSGLGGFIAETVTDAVGGMLEHAVQVPVEDVRVVHDGQGRLDLETVGGGAASFGSDGDGGPTFDPDDAERFVEAFERVRGDR